jgi:hypothetical protein
MDIFQDSTKAVFADICNRVEVPQFVLDSEVVEKQATYDYRDTLFADNMRRRFPIDSPANTWVSAAYFAKTAELDYKDRETREYVEANIKRAAKTYGVEDAVEKVMQAIRTPEQEKSAADDASNWGCFSEKAYPMFDEEGVKLANAYFKDNCYSLKSDVRHEVAKNIVRKCAEYNLEYNDTVRMEAGLGFPDTNFLKENLLDRARRVKSAEQRAAIEKLAEAVEKVDAAELMENVDNLVREVERLDEETGLDKKYGRDILPPSHFCCDISVKDAEDMTEDSVEVDGDVLSLSKLAELPLSVYTSALGDDFGKRVSTDNKIDKVKLANELYSMPKPDQKALSESLKRNA